MNDLTPLPQLRDRRKLGKGLYKSLADAKRSPPGWSASPPAPWARVAATPPAASSHQMFCCKPSRTCATV